MEGSETGDVLEDAVEILVGGETAKCDCIGYRLVIRGVLGIAEDGLSILDAVPRNVLREREGAVTIDGIGDVGAVRTDGGCEVLDGEMRIGEERLFAHDLFDMLHQLVGFFGRSGVRFFGHRLRRY